MIEITRITNYMNVCSGFSVSSFLAMCGLNVRDFWWKLGRGFPCSEQSKAPVNMKCPGLIVSNIDKTVNRCIKFITRLSRRSAINYFIHCQCLSLFGCRPSVAMEFTLQSC